MQAGPGNQGPERGTANSQKQTFEQELADEARTARAQNGAEGKFLFAAGGAGEHQVGNVAATNEQEQGDAGERGQQHGLEAAGHVIGEGTNLYGEVRRIVLGRDFGFAAGDDGEIGFGLFHGDAGFEVPEKKPRF